MTVVVADTSPLNYLVLIGEVSLLPRLYRQVLIPDVVASELSDPETPPIVAEWASHLPPWIEIRPTPVSAEAPDRLDDASVPPFSSLWLSPRRYCCGLTTPKAARRLNVDRFQ